MAYTNTWTTAAPLDTQAANQGAVDFRATKLDVMQRIASFGAGLLAARPTPEATSGTADWTGVMYWTTDTGQVFRWSGSAWVDITDTIGPIGGASSFTSYQNITPVSVVNPPTTGDGQTLILPANSMKVGSLVEVYAAMHHSGGTNSASITLEFVGVPLLGGLCGPASNGPLVFEAKISVISSVIQNCYTQASNDSGTFSSFVITGADITMANGIAEFMGINASASVFFDFIFARITNP